MLMFWIFLILVVVIVAGNALLLLRTAGARASKPTDRDDQSGSV